MGEANTSHMTKTNPRHLAPTNQLPLPESVMAHMLTFLSVQEIHEARTLNRSMGFAGQVAIQTKLRQHGYQSDDPSFAGITKAATSFVGQNRAIQQRLEEELDFAGRRARFGRLQHLCIEMPFVPLLQGHRALEGVWHHLHDANLLERTAYKQANKSGRQVVVGLRLGKAFLKARVNIEQYLQELGAQVQEMHDFDEAVVNFVELQIQKLKVLQRRGHKEAYVSYIPKLKGSSTRNHSYEIVAKALVDSGGRSRRLLDLAKTIDGHGTDQNRLQTLDLSFHGLAVAVPFKDVEALCSEALRKIDSDLKRSLRELREG